MSLKEIAIAHQLNTAEMAQRASGPVGDLRQAIRNQLVAGGHDRELVLSEHERARKNAAYVLAATELFPSLEKEARGERCFVTPDSADAVFLEMTTTCHLGYSDPYYIVGRNKYELLLAQPGTGNSRHMLVFGRRAWGSAVGSSDIIDPAKLFRNAARQKPGSIASSLDGDTGLYRIRPRMSMEGGRSKSSNEVRDNILTPQTMAKFKVVDHLTSLATVFDKMEEFAILTSDWAESLPVAYGNSGHDSMAVRHLAGQMGLAAMTQSGQIEHNHLDLSK